MKAYKNRDIISKTKAALNIKTNADLSLLTDASSPSISQYKRKESTDLNNMIITLLLDKIAELN